MRSFQSSPARGGGCNGREWGWIQMEQMVSILTRPWGRVQLQPRTAGLCALVVSILTRPWGRVQHSELEILPKPPEAFQSSPARGGGCNP